MLNGDESYYLRQNGIKNKVQSSLDQRIGDRVNERNVTTNTLLIFIIVMTRSNVNKGVVPDTSPEMYVIENTKRVC